MSLAINHIFRDELWPNHPTHAALYHIMHHSIEKLSNLWKDRNIDNSFSLFSREGS